MTPDIAIVIALIVFNGLWAFWQHRRIASLEERAATKTHVGLAAKVLKFRHDKLAERQNAVEAALQALPAILTGRFKEYARSDRVAKLENSLDTRIVDLIKTTVENPAEQEHRKCSRCGRVVARYEWFPDSNTAICANCNYKLEWK